MASLRARPGAGRGPRAAAASPSATGSTCACETGAGTRTVLVRSGTLRPDRQPATRRRARPTTGPGSPAWSAWTTPAGASLRHLARALPAAAALPLGAAARPGRHRVVVARRVRRRRARPRVPHPPPADRAAARLRRHLVLPLHRHRGHRRRAARRPGPRGRHHVTRHLAGARRRGPARALGRRTRRARGPSPTSCSRWTARTPSTPPGSPSRRASPA